MKRIDLIRTIRTAAANAGVDFYVLRERGPHTVWAYGRKQVMIPKHREINELTARGILRFLGLGG